MRTSRSKPFFRICTLKLKVLFKPDRNQIISMIFQNVKQMKLKIARIPKSCQSDFRTQKSLALTVFNAMHDFLKSNGDGKSRLMQFFFLISP